MSGLNGVRLADKNRIRVGLNIFGALSTMISVSIWKFRITSGARAVHLGGPSVYQGRRKFEIKQKSRCLQKIKLVNWGGQACRLATALFRMYTGPQF